MVYSLLLLAVGVAGFGLASYWDLKTTEFPDWLPYSMIAAALLIRGGAALLLPDLSIITSALVIGPAFFVFGQVLYRLRQWGDGDAWLLAAMGFLFPDSAGFPVSAAMPFPAAELLAFPVVELLNFFFIAFLYLILYSLAIGVKEHRRIRKRLARELRSDARRIGGEILLVVGVYAGAVISLLAGGIAVSGLLLTPLFPLLLAGMIVFVHYGRFIEAHLFRRQIAAEHLREGDVLLGNRWRGLTAAEVSRIQRKGGKVWIKEGVRFAPVFLLSILVSLFYGNILLLLTQR